MCVRTRQQRVVFSHSFLFIIVSPRPPFPFLSRLSSLALQRTPVDRLGFCCTAAPSCLPILLLVLVSLEPRSSLVLLQPSLFSFRLQCLALRFALGLQCPFSLLLSLSSLFFLFSFFSLLSSTSLFLFSCLSLLSRSPTPDTGRPCSQPAHDHAYHQKLRVRGGKGRGGRKQAKGEV